MAVEPVRLHPDDLAALADAVARRIAGLLREEPLRPAATLLTADEVAERVGRSRDFVYDHAAALGAIRLGDGPRPRLAFNPAAVEAWLTARSTGGGSNREESRSTTPVRTTARRGGPGNRAGLLPVRTLNYPEFDKAGPRRGNARAPATRSKPSPRDERTPPRAGSSPADRPPSSTPTTRGGRDG